MSYARQTLEDVTLSSNIPLELVSIIDRYASSLFDREFYNQLIDISRQTLTLIPRYKNKRFYINKSRFINNIDEVILPLLPSILDSFPRVDDEYETFSSKEENKQYVPFIREYARTLSQRELRRMNNILNEHVSLKSYHDEMRWIMDYTPQRATQLYTDEEIVEFWRRAVNEYLLTDFLREGMDANFYIHFEPASLSDTAPRDAIISIFERLSGVDTTGDIDRISVSKEKRLSQIISGKVNYNTILCYALSFIINERVSEDILDSIEENDFNLDNLIIIMVRNLFEDRKEDIKLILE